MAQLVKRPTLDFGSGRDFTFHGFEPHIGLRAGSVEPAWDFLSPSHHTQFLLSLASCTSKCSTVVTIDKLILTRYC